jgi:CheY-like chemotaxis protein
MAYLLIVDDDLEYAQALGAVLRGDGHEVDVETDAEKTVERVRRRRPDAIVLDVMFPEDDVAGFKVANAVRQAFGDLPILLLTGANRRPVGVGKGGLDAVSLPATEFMEKPIDFQSLSRMVARMLAAHSGKA